MCVYVRQEKSGFVGRTLRESQKKASDGHVMEILNILRQKLELLGSIFELYY